MFKWLANIEVNFLNITVTLDMNCFAYFLTSQPLNVHT